MFKHYICFVNINQAISQTKPFKNSHTKVIVNMVYSYMWLRDQQKDFFKDFDITMQQYNILRILRGAAEPISTATIRDRMLDRASDASRMVNRLEKKGLVVKNTCESDQRKVDVTITENGLDTLKAIDAKIYNWQAETINLTDEEANQLSDLLDKMRN